MSTLSAQDKKWRAENDARTLANSEEIKDDPTRMKAAQLEAGRQAAEAKKAAEALAKIAKIAKAKAKPAKKRTSAKKTPAMRAASKRSR